MKNIIIISKHDISSAYSCLQYLSQELLKYTHVKVWSCTDRKNIDKLDKNFNNSFLNCWYGNFKHIRLLFIYLHVFILLIKNNDAMIINDIDFFPIAWLVKKIRKKKKFIIYHTEIYGADVKTFKFILSFYEKYASDPDFIIECLNERAEYRKKKYNIKKNIYVINNTIYQNTDYTKVNIENKSKEKIVFYAGGCNLSRDLGEFIKEISKVNNVFFLAYCYGTDKDLLSVKNMCKQYFKKNNYSINEAVSRDKLLSIMNSADIGIVYYDPDFSINHYYAAPSKFFEYFSCGLNILSTNNEGINHIIEKYKIGTCIKQNETISDALNRMLLQGLKNRDDIKNIFNERFCYEKDSKFAIENLKKELEI